MKNFVKIIMLLIVTMITSMVFTNCENPRKKTIPVVDSTNIDTIVITPEMHVNSLLEEQADSKHFRTCDSTFIFMPSEIIIKIAYENPDWASYEIAEQYLRHKKEYDEWYMNYKNVEKIKNHPDTTMTNIPDKIPEKPKMDQNNEHVRQI